jgi:hypothetical protein
LLRLPQETPKATEKVLGLPKKQLKQPKRCKAAQDTAKTIEKIIGRAMKPSAKTTDKILGQPKKQQQPLK